MKSQDVITIFLFHFCPGGIFEIMQIRITCGIWGWSKSLERGVRIVLGHYVLIIDIDNTGATIANYICAFIYTYKPLYAKNTYPHI